MIRRLLVPVLLSIIAIGGTASFQPTQSASSEPCIQDHAAWLTQVLKKMETIKPGMTRWDVLKVFRTEEGVHRTEGLPFPGFRETFVSQDCPYFKIDIEFKMFTMGGGVPFRNDDIIVRTAD